MKKRLLSLFLAAVLLLGILPVGAFASGGLEGSGTQDDPYLIADAADLILFRDTVSSSADNRSACALLTADIDLGGASWTPFNPSSGYVTEAFGGVFDGGGHTISGLAVNSDSSAGVGLFGTVCGATIKNLKVEGTVKATNSAFGGGIVGKTQGAVTIDSCSFKGSVELSGKSGSSNGVGGIAGRDNSGELVIRNCVNYADITGNDNLAAGILGSGASNKVNIENCYNMGSVSAKWYASGICANSTKNSSAISNCYNGGSVAAANGGAYCAGISANFRGSVTNCYHLLPESEVKSDYCTGTSVKVESPKGVAAKLGFAFKEDAKGNLLLEWENGETEPQKPEISILSQNGDVLWAQSELGESETLLTVNCIGMDGTQSDPIWNYPQTDAVTLTTPQNSNMLIVSLKDGGSVTVGVSVEYKGELYNDEINITAVPQVTAADIVNKDGAIAQGQTVNAVVYTYGGAEYDESVFPKLEYQWYWYDASGKSSGKIDGAVNNEYCIPEDYPYGYIQLEVYCKGRVLFEHTDTYKPVYSFEYGRLYPVAYDEGFAPVTQDVKDDTPLALPSSHTLGSVCADITWSSSDSDVITDGGIVTLPSSGKASVTLTARFELDGAYCIRTFRVTVWSKEEISKEEARSKLDKAVRALGDGYTIKPVYQENGANVNELLSLKLAEIGFDGIDVSVKSVREIYSGAGIDEYGDITFFYDDPNAERSVWFGSCLVTFELTENNESVCLEDVPVIIPWDVNKVKSAMSEQILDKVVLDEKNKVSENIDLCKAVDGNLWSLISWSSADNSIEISSEKQGTADTLFEPYVGVVTCSTVEKKVTLTAKFCFGLTGYDEDAIVMYKTFTLTLAADSSSESMEQLLAKKLESGLENVGISDYFTGESLDFDNVTGDILFPTTGDFGVDGKYYPVTLTSSNTDVIKNPDVANAARMWVYRPNVGEEPVKVDITIAITEKASGISATKAFTVTVRPLTQQEIDAQITLMERVKAHYFDGIRNTNADAQDITEDLCPFKQAYLNDEGELVWVYDSKNMTRQGIVPTEMEGWYDLQTWRSFRSSNPDVIAHENLLVSRKQDSKAVTLTSYLTSQTLGRYASIYTDNTDLQKLSDQAVSVLLIVRGTDDKLEDSQVRAASAKKAVEEKKTLSVSFTLKSDDGVWIDKGVISGLAEGSTAYDAFIKALSDNGCSFAARGSYIYAITCGGITLSEFDRGSASGWMYKVNGKVVGNYMAAQAIGDGDDILVYYTTGSGAGGAFSGNSAAVTEDAKQDTKPFADVPKSHWAYDYIVAVSDSGLMNGMGEGFAPEGNASRAMLWTVLARMASANLTDRGAWYDAAAAWAKAVGITDASTPNENLTREQAVTMLYRYAMVMGADVSRIGDISAFRDNAEISVWAYDALRWAVGVGILNGEDGALCPGDGITRAELAAILVRFSESAA